MELLPVEEQKSVLRRQDRRLRAIGREARDESVHRLALVRHEARDVDEGRHLGMVSRLGDDRAAVGVATRTTGSLCASMARLVTATSSACESVGFWTTLT